MSDSASSSFELDARLHVTAQEQGRAREFPIGVPTVEGMTLTIGRSRSADLTIHDDYISNQHVKITFRRGEHWIEDLGSTHGSKLNGRPLTKPETLTTGDVVLLGRSQFEYRCTRRSLAEVGSIADYADEKAEDVGAAGVTAVTGVTVVDGTNQTLAQAKAQSAAKAAAEAEKSRQAKAAAAPAAETAKTPPASATPATAPREKPGLVTIIAAIGGVAAILALVCYLAWQIFFAGGT